MLYSFVNLMYEIHGSSLCLIILFICISISIVITLIFSRHRMPTEVRDRENPVLMGFSANISVIYAILVGFTILYSMNNFDHADHLVQHEASTALDIFRTAKALPKSEQIAVQAEMKTYVNKVLAVEWRDQREGIVNLAAEAELRGLATTLDSYRPKDGNQILLRQRLLDKLNELYDAHEERTNMATLALASEFWIILIIATIFTLIINGMVGLDLKIHLIAMTMFATVVGLVFYLAVAMDRPFRGDFSVQPTAFESALSSMEH